MNKNSWKINTILIIGLGLMGGSFAKMIKKKLPMVKIIGVDTSYCNESVFDDCTSLDDVYFEKQNISTVDYAIQNGIIDEGSMDISLVNVEDADLIILGTPLHLYETVIGSIIHRVNPNSIITDIGSVKGKPQRIVSQLVLGKSTFIGGHPMRGSDKSGIQNANEKIYDNTVFFLTPYIEETDEISYELNCKVEILKEFLLELGLRPNIVSAKLHDMFVAKTSHVPHIAAAFLIDGISDVGLSSFKFIADGFKDTTRIAASNPKLWADIFINNKETIIEELESMKKDIDFFIDSLNKNQVEELEKYLTNTSELRKSLNSMILKGE